jgi:hypothetical protein
MENIKLLQTVSDISYIAGYSNHYSGNSRFDIAQYIAWAKEFENIHQNTNWDFDDYMLLIEAFANRKIQEFSVYFK